MSDHNPVLYRVEDGIAWLTFNRPDRMNALTSEMAQRCLDIVDEARQDPAIRVLVLTGAGRGFCSGADTRGLFETRSQDNASSEALDHNGIQRFTSAMLYLDKPVIAAINGPCVGAGFELTLACDIRVAASSAYFMEAAMRHGLVPGDGSVLMLPKIVGLGHANDILFTGRKVPADEAARMGLVRDVVPDDELLAFVADLAGHLASRAPDANALLKQGIRLGFGSPEFGNVLSFLRLAVSQGQAARAAERSADGS